MSNLVKINDLSKSPLWKRYSPTEFIAETNYAVKWRRVSTAGQKKKGHFSDEAQDDNIEEYILKENLDVLKSWNVAETASKHDKRKHFHEMVEFIIASQRTKTPIKHVIFSYTSRSSRNKQSRQELERLLDLGIVIHFARDNLKLTCQSDLSAKMQWLFKSYKDEEDIEIHKRNIWEGTLKRLEMGLFPGKAPYGYKNYRPHEDELSYFILAEGRCDYVRDAFDWFSTGIYTEVELIAKLDAAYPKLTKKPDAKRLSEILRNPFYYGEFYYLGSLWKGNPDENLYPKLISYELWKKVQVLLDNRHRKTVKERSLPYLGMMTCGGFILDDNGNETQEACGCAVTGEEKRKKLADGTISYHYHYHCSNGTRRCSQRNKNFIQNIGRKYISYHEAEIELLFEKIFKPLNFTDEVCKWMQDVLRKEHAEKSRDHYTQLSAYQDRHKMLERYIDKAYEDKLAEEITEDQWRTQHNKWMAEKTQLKNQIDALDGKKDDYIQKGVMLIELAQRTESIYKNATTDVKRKMVRLISSNHSLRNGDVEFNWEKPFDLLASAHPQEKWWTRTGSNR